MADPEGRGSELKEALFNYKAMLLKITTTEWNGHFEVQPFSSKGYNQCDFYLGNLPRIQLTLVYKVCNQRSLEVAF